MTSEQDAPAFLSWEIDLRLVTDPFVLYDTGKVVLISALLIIFVGSLIALMLGGATAPWEEWRMGLQIVVLVFGGLGLGMLLVMLVFFGNRFPVRMTLEPRGVRWEALSRRGRWANRGAVVLGLLAGQPAVAGAGMLAASRRVETMRWKDIQRVRFHPQFHVISLMNGWRVVIRLHCPSALYPEVADRIRAAAVHARMEGHAA